MSEHPSTMRGESQPVAAVDWNDAATLHRGDDGGGLMHSFKSVRHGTLAELIRFVMILPEPERALYAIEKAGDHRLGYDEIAILARRADFPA